jgi:hypothetical protein
MKEKFGIIFEMLMYWGLLLVVASIVPVGGIFLIKWIITMGEVAIFLSGALAVVLLAIEVFVLIVLFHIFIPDNF